MKGEHLRYVKGHHNKTGGKVAERRARRSNDPEWRGARVRNTDGYIVLTISPAHPFARMGYQEKRDPSAVKVLEHRLVMAGHLGRPLERWEEVHHVNGVRDENRIGNLQLRVKPHGRGSVYVCLDCGSHRVSPVALPEGG